MNFLAISGLINFITSICLGLFVLLKNIRSSQNRAYFYVSFFVALYSFGYWIHQTTVTADTALFWMKVQTIGFILITPTYLHFVFAFLDLAKSKRRELIIYYILNLSFAVCVIFSLFYKEVVPIHNLGFWPIALPLANLYLIFWLWQIFYGLFWLLKAFRITKGIKREQVKYFTVAAIIGFAGGGTNWFLWYNIPFVPLTASISLYVGIIAYSLIRFKFLNIVTLTSKGIFVLCYSVILVVPFLTGYVTKNWLIATILAVFAGVVGPFVYKWLAAKTEIQLLSDQKRYQRLLKDTTYQMLGYHNIKRLADHVVKACVDSVHMGNAYIFLRDQENDKFGLTAAGDKSKTPVIFSIEMAHPVMRALHGNTHYLNLEAMAMEYDHTAVDGTNKKILKFSESLEISLIFTIRDKGKVIGLLALGPKLNGAIYTPDDIETFSLLCAQMALAIENCRYEEEIALLASFPEEDPRPICEISAKGNVTYMNSAAKKLFPSLKAAGFKHPWLEVVEPLLDTIQKEEGAGLVNEVEIDNRYYEQTMYYVPSGNKLRVYGLDITDRKEAQIALQVSEASYRAIFESANDAIIIRDINTYRVVDANEKACEMFLYTKEEMIGQDMDVISSGQPPYDAKSIAKFFNKAAQGEPQLFEIFVKDKAGRLFWVEANLRRAVIGGVYRFLTITRDITERKAAEKNRGKD